MPAVSAILAHGDIPTSQLSDLSEAGSVVIAVNSLTITPMRDEKTYTNASGAVFAVEYRNPRIELKFDGYVSAYDGLADEHPGTQITTLTNFTTALHGFDPADGVIVYAECERSLSNDDSARTSFTARQFPFINAS